jgi:hypothetical protein
MTDRDSSDSKSERDTKERDEAPGISTVSEFFKNLVDDDEAVISRKEFCAQISEHVTNVAMWVGLDAALGAGDRAEVSSDRVTDVPRDRTRGNAFIAVGVVAEIGSDLMMSALQLLEGGRLYSGSALIRQLIECEYLLRVFRMNFEEGSRWLTATDEERWDFSPGKLRKIIGFDRQEYANHCDAGGHPNPKGGHLLELQGQIERLNRHVESDDPRPEYVRLIWLDFAFHCDRTWRALHDVLTQEHARYERVRSETIDFASKAFAEWSSADPLAKHFGKIEVVLRENPLTPLEKFFGTRQLD